MVCYNWQGPKQFARKMQLQLDRFQVGLLLNEKLMVGILFSGKHRQKMTNLQQMATRIIFRRIILSHIYRKNFLVLKRYAALRYQLTAPANCAIFAQTVSLSKISLL